MQVGGEKEIIRLRGKKKKKIVRYLEALAFALSNPDVKVIEVAGSGNALRKLVEFFSLITERLPVISSKLKISPLTVKEYQELRTKKGRTIRIPVYSFTIEKTGELSDDDLRAECPEGYKHIRVTSRKTYHSYVNAFALAVNTREGPGVCLEGAGLAIENLIRTVNFIEKNAPVLLKMVELERIGFGSGIAPSGEKFGKIVLVYRIKGESL